MKVKKCPIHKVQMVRVTMTFCPACRGSATSERKSQASKENGKLGGRPKGSKDRKPRSLKKKRAA
jgi:hypothetical protein